MKDSSVTLFIPPFSVALTRINERIFTYRRFLRFLRFSLKRAPRRHDSQTIVLVLAQELGSVYLEGVYTLEFRIILE